MDYSHFSVERFVIDHDFQDWVKHPTRENSLFWQKWVKEHPEKAEEVHEARLIILAMDFKKTPASEVPKELLFQKITDTLADLDNPSIPIDRSAVNIYLKAAAIFLGVLISTATLYFLTANTSETYSTAFGEIRALTLPDGSEVVLNANSSISFRNNWKDREAREVSLQGEAFFNIVHKENDKRFVVSTDQLDVVVLGTTFNVQTRRNKTQVVLNSGRVKLNRRGSGDDSLYMDPGELVEVSGDDDALIKKVVNPEQFSSWRKNQLIFEATPLSEIAQTLTDNYGWEITFQKDSMKAYQFTGTVSTASAEKVELLLLSISEAFDLKMIREGNRIDFMKK